MYVHLTYLMIAIMIVVFGFILYHKLTDNTKTYHGISMAKTSLHEAIKTMVSGNDECKNNSITHSDKSPQSSQSQYNENDHVNQVIDGTVTGLVDGALTTSFTDFGTDLEIAFENVLENGMQYEFMDGSIGSSGTSGTDLENANLKLLAKYLTLLIRKNEAERELYTIETGKREVYHSPRLVQLNKQITVFKQKIRDNPDALKYFNENLDITL